MNYATAVLFVLLALMGQDVQAAAPIKPKLLFTGKMNYEVRGSTFTRYTLAVFNRSELPGDLFDVAPDLPPCGSNKESARSWVDVYNGEGKRIYGFCALKSSADLSNLWFALPVGEAAPAAVYIVINDRKLNKDYKSNLVKTGP